MDLMLSGVHGRALIPLAILLCGSTACSEAEHGGTKVPPGGRAHLVVPGTANGVTVQLPAKAHQSWVHGSYTLCLDEPGDVRVEAVEFQTGDLTISDWALQSGPTPDAEGVRMFTGDVHGTLQSHGIENVDVLERVCDGKGNSYELVLELETGNESSQGDGVIVRYVSDGEEGTVALPERVVMCVKPETPSCT